MRGTQADFDSDRLLEERARGAISIVAIGTVCLALGELTLRFGEKPWISVAQISCLLALLALLLILPRWRDRRGRIIVALASTAIAAATSAAVAVLSGQSTTSMIVLVGLAMGAAAYMPWGGRAQLIAVSFLAIAYPVELYLSHESILAHSRDLAGLYVVLAGSVYIAYEMERQRRIAAREQAQRREHEAEIERQRAFLYQVIDINPHLVFAKDREGRFTLANQAVAAVYGSHVGDLIGKTDADFNENAEEVANFRRDDLYVIESREQKHIAEEVITDAQGQRRFLETIKRPLVGVDGSADQLLGVATDITTRKNAEERLREEGEIAATLARVGREIIESLSRPGALPRLCELATEALGGNSSLMWIFDSDFNAFVPAACANLPPENWEALRVLRVDRKIFLDWCAGIETGEPIFVTRDYVVERAPVALRSIIPEARRLAAIPLMRQGQVNGALVLTFIQQGLPPTSAEVRIAQGIAQLASLAMENARLVDELDRANQLKSEFVATMSHELRTPLNVILGYDALLRDGAMGELNQDQQQTLQRIHDNALQLLSLVTATLDMSRLEAGQVHVDLQIVDLHKVFTELQAQMYEARTKPGVHFDWHVENDVPLLHTDAIKLKVILTNLVTNALKFTHQGRVTARARIEGDALLIEVADTGIGIAASAHTAIFEPFRQGDRSIGERFGGVGLGLYITRRLLEILGGTISVESEEGIGSTFRVRLPLRQRRPAVASSQAA